MHSSSFKALASRIHPPLPLSPRQSQQLLSALKGSFRKQLDKEHPQPGNDGAVDSAVLGRRSSSPSPDAPRRPYALRHYESILQHPLFAPGQVVDSKTRVFSDAEDKSLNYKISDVREIMQDPVAWFDGYVARGAATASHAEHFLWSLRKSVASKDDAERRRAMKESGAGSKVVDWLWSSGLDQISVLYTHPNLVKILMLFLWEEGRWETLLDWLRRSPISSPGMKEVCQDAMIRWRSKFLNDVINQQLINEPDCSPVIHFFLKVISNMEDPHGSKEAAQQAERTLLHAGRTMFNHLCKPRAKTRFVVNASLYDQFMDTVCIWNRRWVFDKALLWMYHPERPDTAPALRQVTTHREDPILRRLLQTYSPQQRSWYARFCSELSDMLLQKGNHQEAAFVMRVLNEHFPPDVGTRGAFRFQESNDGPATRDYWARLRTAELNGQQKWSLSLVDSLAGV